MATATLKAKLTLNDSLFHAGLRKSVAASKTAGAAIGSGLKRTIGGAVGVIGGLIAGTITAAAFAGGIKGVYDMSGGLKDLHDQTGASIESLIVLQQAFEDGGSSADAVGSSLNRMQKFLSEASKEGGSARVMMTKLGLDLAKISRLSPEDQFQAIGSAIGGLATPTQRTAAAMAIFGKSGAELMPLFNDFEGIMGTASRSLGAQAGILARNSETFDLISERLDRAGIKLRGFFVGVASALAPTMLQLTAALDNADFASAGERFGAAIKTAAEAFVGAFKDPGEALNAWHSLVKAGMAQVLVMIRDGLLGIAISWSTKLRESIPGLLSGLSAGMTSLMQGATKTLRGGITGAIALMYDALISAAAGFNAVIMKGVYEIMEALGEIPIIGKKLGLSGFNAPTVAEQYSREKEALKNNPLDRVMDVLRAGSRADLSAPNDAIAKFTEALKKGGEHLVKEVVMGDFGRAKYLADAARSRDKLAAAGRATIDNVLGGMPNPIQEFMSDPYRNFRSFRAFSGQTGRGAGQGLMTGQLGNNGGLSGGAFGAVRRGDKARKDAAEAARKKELQGVDKSNDILSDIAGTMKTAWT